LYFIVVTAVGATDGPQNGDPEVACQSTTGGVITTGGGFSSYWEAPSWQTKAIANFFNTTSADGNTPSSGYNPQGRGYPDISLLGADYPVYVNGNLYTLYGTSASSPVFAAYVSLINALRLAEGETSIGWLNPTLYSAGGDVTFANTSTIVYNDITSGDNKCCASNQPQTATCCTAGFTTCTGWDPVTGWGSISYSNFALLFGYAVPNYAPSSGGDGSSGGNTDTIILVVLLVVLVVGIVGCLSQARKLCGRKQNTNAEWSGQIHEIPVIHHSTSTTYTASSPGAASLYMSQGNNNPGNLGPRPVGNITGSSEPPPPSYDSHTTPGAYNSGGAVPIASAIPVSVSTNINNPILAQNAKASPPVGAPMPSSVAAAPPATQSKPKSKGGKGKGGKK